MSIGVEFQNGKNSEDETLTLVQMLKQANLKMNKETHAFTVLAFTVSPVERGDPEGELQTSADVFK